MLSDAANGSGPAFEAPTGNAVDREGQVIVIDSLIDAIVRIDSITGDRTIAPNDSLGTGAGIESPLGIVDDPDGTIVVTDTVYDAVFQIDPFSGDRKIVSKF